MPTLFIYLFEVSICLIVFYGLYHLLLKNLGNFQYNRVYFISSYLLSFLIPYFAFDVFPIYVEAISSGQIPLRLSGNEIDASSVSSLSLNEFLIFVYATICALFSFRFLKGIWTITSQIRTSTKHDHDEFTIVENEINNQTFTFFSFLFQPKSKKIDNEVAAHEMIHIKQWHTIDILISEVVKIVLWFNPIVYLMQTKVKLNHEYICDSFAASLTTPFQYAQYLSKSITNNKNLILASNFAYKLKNRIIMLEKSVNNLNQKWRYLSLFPLIVILMFFFSCEQYIVEKESPESNLKMIVSDTVITFNYDTYEEKIEIVNREVDAAYVIDTVIVFDYDTNEESTQIVKTLVPANPSDAENQNKYKNSLNRNNVTESKVSKFEGDFGIDTISSLDYDSGESNEKIIVNTNECYGFYWGERFNSNDEMSIKDAINNLTSRIQILRQNRNDDCEPVKSISGKFVFVTKNMDPVVVRFNNKKNKIGDDAMIKALIKKSAKIFIEDLKVNGEIQLKGKVITII